MANTTSVEVRSANNEFVRITDSSSISVNQNLTVMFWAKWTTTPAAGFYFFSKSTASQLSYHAHVTWSRIRFSVWSASGTRNELQWSQDPPTDGAWHHYAFVWDGAVGATSMKYILDGVEQTGATTRYESVGLVCNDTTDPLDIGASDSGNYANGKYTEFQVFDVTKTVSWVNSNYTTEISSSETGTQALLKFESSLLDETANNNDGAYNGTGTVSYAADVPTLSSGGGGDTAGAAALASTGSMTSSGVVDFSSTAALSSSGSLSSTGSIDYAGTASLAGTGSLASSGDVDMPAIANLASVSSLSASGGSDVSGSFGSALSSSLSATGSIDYAGAASLASSGTLSATGDVGGDTSATAAMVASSALSAAGSPDMGGTASLNSSASLSASGVVGTTGSAGIAALSVLAASGQYALSSSAAFALLASLSATGSSSALGDSLPLSGLLVSRSSTVMTGQASKTKRSGSASRVTMTATLTSTTMTAS